MVFHRKCLVLSPYPDPVVRIVEALGDKAEVAEGIKGTPDWIICHGHKRIIREPDLTVFKDRIVNLHISYLPYGRGADPNLWAWVNGEPHGVSLHYVNAGIDSGDLIAQRIVPMGAEETLGSSYLKLQQAAVALFETVWPALRNGHADRRPQKGPGSFHRMKDRTRITLPNGWDTPIQQVAAKTQLTGIKS